MVEAKAGVLSSTLSNYHSSVTIISGIQISFRPSMLALINDCVTCCFVGCGCTKLPRIAWISTMDRLATYGASLRRAKCSGNGNLAAERVRGNMDHGPKNCHCPKIRVAFALSRMMSQINEIVMKPLYLKLFEKFDFF